MVKAKNLLLYITLIILGTYFLFSGLIKAQSFLGPFVTAIILALLVFPLSGWMEQKISRSAASLINAFFLFLVSLAFLGLLSYQLESFVEKWPKIKETMKPKIEQVKQFAVNNTPLNESDLQLSSKKNGSGMIPAVSSSGQVPQKKAATLLSTISGAVGNFLLTFIYVFFLLNYRRKFKNFLLRVFPDEKRDKVNSVIIKSAKVAPKYLVGRLVLIAFLAILYAIGLGISGVNNFILVSIVAAILSLIPYLGNIIGLAMAMAFGYLTSGEIGVLVGIIITFSVAQFLESYVLEPYVVGDRVDLHPFVVILAVVIGNLVWGIIGMILAIPVVGILTVILLHIEALKPYGILLSKRKFSKD
ncbi:AI-2E family transporter [Zunongwangia sp. F363]|uniref:AI-2E family transporter n=1 Tax=Autumnicola tepida TaxID=3075595 RepID=A0ABU3C9C6_9FLAO|nr:AI-2E family transporter [Zunongwangia sp. F363]MDT0642914.1 AI-2E family transporter [Zunongwangia sp. F363]